MIKYPKFVIRKIKNGKVMIFGQIFRPDTRWLQYDGRLDGMNYAFGLYFKGKEWDKDLVCLWGTEKAFKSHCEDVDWPGPECVDGAFNWEWWFS